MKKTLLFALALAPFALLHAQNEIADVASPDGRLVVSFDIAGVENPTYTVTYDGKVMLEKSPIGIMLDMGSKPTLEGLPTGREAGNGDFTKNLTLVKGKVESSEVNYSIDRIKTANVSHKYNAVILSLQNAAKQDIEFEFRISDNDIAVRYNIPKPRQRASTRVLFENTGFRFPDGTTTFLTPQSDAMIGWQRSKPSYEEGYSNDGPMNVRSQYGHGYTFPCLFHVGENGWVLLSESGVSSEYCGSRIGDCKDNTYKIEFPMPDENNGIGTVCPAFRLPFSTPWRTITVGADLKPIVETTVMWDYVEPLYEPSREYKYGRGTWSWIVWQDASCNYDDQVKFIDLASAMDFEYILIDAGWDENIGYDRMEQLIKYANSKNVDVFLWYSSSGYWNDIVQSPICKMDNSIIRKKEFAWLEKVGVKGIKVDFWGGDKQETIRLYEEVLSDANDHGIMCIFHGCTMPRGWERMYPNYVGSEAVLASENMYFGQGSCDEEAFKATLHPFIRNAAGCMEFGGCFMNRILNKTNSGRGSQLKTTPIFQIATQIIYQNPIQMVAVCPNNLEDAPEICMDWLKDSPTTWTETRFLDGYPGKYVILARKSTDGRLFVAGMNATKEPIKAKIDLSFLGDGEVSLYTDDKKTMDPVLSTLKLKTKKPYQFEIQPSGATMIMK